VHADSDFTFDADLVRRYDAYGPRYTSYPTADRFDASFTPEKYVDWLVRRTGEGRRLPLSIYVHLPFCNTICYYCACNKIITKDHGRSAKYIRYVGREARLNRSLMEGEHLVRQLHWGGGTPTFLSHGEMRDLVGILRENFTFDPAAECSIEVDPRKVDEATIEVLGSLGFNRMSVGVQDFDPDVQRAVNRIQTEEETLRVMAAARARGFQSINVDLIYGLPKQSVASYARTLEKVIAAAPDRIALYSYAHVPHLFKPQRRIGDYELPSPETKLGILALAIEELRRAGYVYIGMDHFAKPEDELAVAQRERRLHRNFQGYSTHADCDLLAFGISAIGRIGPTYSQNVRTLDEYYERLDRNVVPVFRGIELTADDLLRRDVIQQLMCHFELDFAAVERAHGIDFARTFATELELLRPLAADGLVEVEPARLRVTPRGRMLVRTVAMTFDRHLREAQEKARYSKVI
jgi:oxygen-independent coproporphyrinogen-3 oxidase